MQLIAVVAGLFFWGFNIVGAKETTRLQVMMVFGLLGILAFLVIKGAPVIRQEYYTPLAPEGWGKLLPTAALVFISYIGVTKVASMAEEMKNPNRNLPAGMFLSLVSILILYGLVVSVVVGIVPAEQLYSSLTPLSDAAAIAIGPHGKIWVSIAAALAFATTANAGIMSASRYLLAIVAVTGLERIAKLASTFQLLVFAFVNIAVIVMRASWIKSYDPGFRSPLYPWMQIIGIMISVVLIPEMGLLSSIFAMGLVAIGVVWHNLYVKPRVEPQFGAVAKMAERMGERLLERNADAMGLGSRKDPTRHLRFLAEIARRAENPDFIPKWLDAADVSSLTGHLLGDDAE